MTINQDSFLEALRYLIKNRRNVSQEWLAKETGVSQQGISAILLGKSRGRQATREKIAKAFGLSYENLLALGSHIIAGKGPEVEPEPPQDSITIVQVGSKEDKDLLQEHSPDYRGVPLYESGRLAAGNGGLIFDPYEKPDSHVLVYLPELGRRANHKLASMRVGGDSMEPVIPQGSIVVVDMSDKALVNNKIFVVQDPEGEMYGAVKRIQKTNEEGVYALVSDNSRVPPIVVRGNWEEMVVGRVVWMWRSLLGA